MTKVVVDRNLLFGLLALQTGLINQGALFTAFNTWRWDKTRSMADVLVDQGALDTALRSVLEALVAEHLKMHGDDPEKSLAAIDAGRSTRERLAQLEDSDLAASIANIGSNQALFDIGGDHACPDGVTRSTEAVDLMLGEQRTRSGGGDADRDSSVSVGESSSRDLRFRVLRPHRSGGLGAVFVALDAELNREVALKQILDRHADDPVSRSRFVLEAEITGGLAHPGIVPVYGLGTYGPGRPFYAMRFIKGDTLKDFIAAFHADMSLKSDSGRRSLELRKLLRRFVDVCNAIEYAHSRGVLHRDIKPGNIIVGKHGETLVVDWGLAKVVGRTERGALSEERTLVPSSASGSAETLPGAAVGTPAFMSPEQAVGDLARLGPRSDVYSLGATLYALLTGHPPFEGNDLGAILEAVWLGAFPRPRKHDPSIDGALEAICLRAMARSPDDRYASPRILADDIERWMADEPVTAWREPIGRRARRWGKRNRTIVTAAASALVVALLGTAAVLAVQTQANADLRMANGLLSAANDRERKYNIELAAANDRERARFALALDAIKLFHGEVSSDLLLKEKQFDELRNKLLRGAADFYVKLEGLLKDQPDGTSRAALGTAYAELAGLTAKIGNKPDALALHLKAVTVRRELASTLGADSATVLSLAQSLRFLGDLRRATGDMAGARTDYDEALHLAQSVQQSATASSAAETSLAKIHNAIGALQFDIGDMKGALRSYGEAVAIQEKAANFSPTSGEIKRDLAESHHNITMVDDQIGDMKGALKSARRALEMAEAAVSAKPADFDFQSRLASSYNAMGVIQAKSGDTAGALKSYRGAVSFLEKLVAANPAVTSFQDSLALIHYNIGLVEVDIGDTGGALKSYQQAVDIQQKLADGHPADTQVQSNLGNSVLSIAMVLRATGDLSAALRNFNRAVTIQEKLADKNPTVTRFQSNLAITLYNRGSAERQMGAMENALKSHIQAAHIAEKLVDAFPTMTHYRHLLSVILSGTANVRFEAVQIASAIELYRRAAAILQRLVDDNPSVPSYKDALAVTHDCIGNAEFEIRADAAAIASYQRSAAIWEKLVSDYPTVTSYLNSQAFTINAAGRVSEKKGDLSAALKLYRQSLALREQLAAANRGVPAYSERLATTLCNVGDVLARTGQFAEAKKHYERAVAIAEDLTRYKFDSYTSRLARALCRLGKAQVSLGETAGGTAKIRRAITLLDGLDSVYTFDIEDLARGHAQLARLAGSPGSSFNAESSESESEKAVEFLRKAVAGGFRDSRIQNDPDFAPLRPRPDFQLLMMDAAIPVSPFCDPAVLVGLPSE